MNTKKEIKTFFTWLRNGTCFVVTWFLILDLIVRWILGTDTISVANLTKTIVWTVGGVLIFCVAFTKLFIRKFGFTARLTIFMSTIMFYEILFFYNIGLFADTGNLRQWLLFFFIILFLYFVCLMIYGSYRKKKCELYTHELQRYQKERSVVNNTDESL